jgi:HEAT repeat protein
MRIISPRSAIARLLPELQGNDALKTFEILKPMLHSPGVDPELAVAALNKALSMGRESSGNEQLSIEAAEEIGSIGPPARAAVPSLELAARDLRSNIGDAAVDALRHVDPERANEWAIANLLTFSSADVRRRAAGVLAKADPAPEKAVPTLLRAAEDSDPAVRDAAKEALSHVAPGLLRRRGLAK